MEVSLTMQVLQGQPYTVLYNEKRLESMSSNRGAPYAARPASSGKRLYVGNLSWNVTWKELKVLCS